MKTVAIRQCAKCGDQFKSLVKWVNGKKEFMRRLCFNCLPYRGYERAIPIEKKCVKCGRIFRTTYDTKIKCRTGCDAKERPDNCLWCWVSIFRTNNGRMKDYCSRSCRDAAWALCKGSGLSPSETLRELRKTEEGIAVLTRWVGAYENRKQRRKISGILYKLTRKKELNENAMSILREAVYGR